MGWTSPRTWVSGEVLTAALLNIHLRDNMLGADAGVTNGANVTAAGTRSYQRCGSVIVNVNLTATANLIAGATLFTIASGHRPPSGVTIFGTLVNGTTEAPVRVAAADTGVVTTGVAITSDWTLRGQIVIPL